MAKMKIKKGDTVVVTSGRSKGVTGKVLKSSPKDSTLVVSGANIVVRHDRVHGLTKKEAAIHISNVALLDPKTNRPTRVKWKLLADGTKVRVAVKTDEVIA